MINKWNRKYLKLAKTLAEDNDTCYSRSIGSVLVSDQNFLLAVGYNGPAISVPHADTKKYLTNLANIIEKEEWKTLKSKNINSKEQFIKSLEGCKICPRKFLDIKSGEKLQYCPCSHSERNCIFSAAANGSCTKNSILYCYCQVPCHECTIALIQAKIKKVVCCDFGHELYSKSSPLLLKMAKIQIEVVNPDTFETIENHIWQR